MERASVPGGQSAVLQVVILRDGLLVGTEVFVPGAYTLGSGAGVDVRLEDPSVDALHATLYFQNGRAAIQDSNSRSGIYVNGHRIRACEVRSQDEVLCGPFVLKTRVVVKHASPQVTRAPPEVEALLAGRPLPPPPQPPSIAPVAGPDPSPVTAATQVRAPVRRPLNAAPVGDTTEPEVSRPVPAHVAMPGTVPSARRKAAATRGPTYEPLPPPVPDEDWSTEAIEVDAAMLEYGAEAEEVTSAERPGAIGSTFAATNVSTKPPTRVVAPPTPSATLRPGVAAPHATSNAKGRGRPHLNVELYWGEVRCEARSFHKLPSKKPLVAAARDTAGMPLWGFTLPDEAFELATSAGKAFRVFVPPNATVEAQAEGSTTFAPVEPTVEPGGSKRRYLTLTSGCAARLCEGEMSLVVYAAPRAERPWGNPLRSVPWLMLIVLTIFGGGFVSFLRYLPQRPEGPDFSARGLPSVAVKLIAPEPQKKAEAKKQLEKIKARAEKAKQLSTKTKDKEKPPEKLATKKTQKKEPVASRPAAQSKALQALARLSAAGPATNDVLAAADKAGTGPGSKKSPFKLSGLVGKDPVANAGIGTFGLGGGGKGGTATRGLEVLNGSGGGGIGALGASGFGKGRGVGGTVTRASPRQIGAKGSIDREAVAKVINAHFQEVRGCYERALLKEPGLSGKAVLEWTISTRGSVTATRTKSSTLRNAEVEGCILRAIKAWRFPPARGGSVIITYPFLFNSVGY